MQPAVVLIAILAISGLLVPVLIALARTDFARRHKVREDRPHRIAPAVYWRGLLANSVVSGGILVVVPLTLGSYLFVEKPVGVWRALGEAAAILLLYDLGYYLLHRFLFHEWSVGRRIHAVHHTIRTPYARDSLYIHPIETASGVGLLLACTAIVGPVGMSSFALALLTYSFLNVFIHSSFDVRVFPLRTLTALVRNHDTHHESMKSGYYASITPLWDVVFGTARRPQPRR
jgi:sterol desaturase/sphingolipid hydroxylase (fatty acid hydroxylase superfamily)